REPIEFPSLVDERLVWLALEDWSPGAEIGVMWFGDDHEVVIDYARKNAFTHVEINVGRLAWAAVRSLTVGLLPPVGFIEIGRGAWEYAAERAAAERRPCTACPFLLGSNLDCETCRARVIARKEPTATWRRYHVRDGIVALEFDEDIAEEAAAAAERALAQVDAPILTHQFFHQWSIRFAKESAGVFAYEDDQLIARDLIEAQMLALWFALPPQLPPREALDVPPAVSEATIKSQARAMIRSMLERGARRAEALRQVGTRRALRKLVQAQAELFGEGARVVGDLGQPTLVIDRDGQPVLSVASTPLGPRHEASSNLADAEREQLLARLNDIHRRLVHAVKIERAATRGDNEGRAIDRAMVNLRRSL